VTRLPPELPRDAISQPAAACAAPASASPTTRGPRYTLRPGPETGPERAALERYVDAGFHRKHGARIRSFLPVLLELRDRAGRLCAVAGYRPAAAGRLFLEQYLDEPVEAAIARGAGLAVERDAVVEVGNLSALNCRAARELAARLPALLDGAGYRWLTFTGTRVIRELLEGFEAPMLDLGAADHARLSSTDDDWGAYYESQPRVLAGYLPHGRALAAFAGSYDH